MSVGDNVICIYSCLYVFNETPFATSRICQFLSKVKLVWSQGFPSKLVTNLGLKKQVSSYLPIGAGEELDSCFFLGHSRGVKIKEPRLGFEFRFSIPLSNDNNC